MVKQTSKATTRKNKSGSIWKSLGITDKRGMELQKRMYETLQEIKDISWKNPEGISSEEIIQKFERVTEGVSSLEKTVMIYYATKILERSRDPLANLLSMIK